MRRIARARLTAFIIYILWSRTKSFEFQTVSVSVSLLQMSDAFISTVSANCIICTLFYLQDSIKSATNLLLVR